MPKDKDFDRAMEDGRRNQEVKQLILNWCGHARIEKIGGTGLIELQTGFPIGHHSMACDHAPAGGVATWYLEDASLQFHDQNCVGCNKRQPLRIPNLSKLVAQRDSDVERAQREEAKRAERLHLEYEQRKKVRNSLRGCGLAAVDSLLDDLDLFDRERSETARAQIEETARLAPELFVGEIASYIFNLLESEELWFEEVGLTVLRHTQGDKLRLARCAMHSLVAGRALCIAAKIVQENVEFIEETDVENAVRSLAILAAPPTDPFYHDTPEKFSEPLLAFYNQFSVSVRSGFEALLRSDHPFDIETASKAIVVLAASDKEVATAFTKSLLAKLARIDRVVDSDRNSEVNHTAHELANALVSAFFADPESTDTEIMRYFEGALPDGEARLASVYAEVIRRGTYDHDGESISELKPYRYALRRLIALSGSSANEEVLKEVLEALRGEPSWLITLVRQESDLLLGGAAVLDTRIQQFDAEPEREDLNNWLEVLERQNRRSTLYYLRESMISWVAQGASQNDEGTREFVSFIQRTDSLSESFRSGLIKELPPLMQTATGVNTVLSVLYSAMVSRSTMERAAAAKVIRELGSQRVADLPNLVLDAFMLLLTDPYVIVHKATVDALRSISLPKEYNQYVASAVWQLIHVYNDNEEQDDFLLSCINVYTKLSKDDPKFTSGPGRIIVALLHKVKPSTLTRHSNRWTLKPLSACEGFAELVIYLLRHANPYDADKEIVLELLREVPSAALETQVNDLLMIAKEQVADIHTIGTLIEVFTELGKWSAAEEVAQNHLDSFADNVRMRAIRFSTLQRRLAITFERLISEGRMEDAIATSILWKKTAQQLEEVRKDNERKNPFPS